MTCPIKLTGLFDVRARSANTDHPLALLLVRAAMVRAGR